MEAVHDAIHSTIDSTTPHFNVSCQTCRISKTYVTLQGVNSFFGEHEGHRVIEGGLFERPLTAKRAEAVAEEASKPRAEEAPAQEVAAASAEVIAQVGEPSLEEATTPAEAIAQELHPQAEGTANAQAREEAPAPFAPLAQMTQSAEVQRREPTLAVAPPFLSEGDLEEPLLLARSSYIGESREKRIDALRVSRALKEFKWNVEPPYVIGVMVDDNLSVETNIGVISSSMVERVEKLGYKFVAVNVPQGSPVAWFKREARGSLETNSPVGDSETMMQISQGKRTYDKDKAVWQESFVSLLMSVKDMDGQNLKRVTNIIKSERPEPDLQE